MPTLHPSPTLADFHQYVQEMVKERGFIGQSTELIFMRLLEEAGELAKASRNHHKEPTDDHQKQIAHEAADVFIYLLDICNRFHINLEQAFREKEAINDKRIWKG